MLDAAAVPGPRAGAGIGIAHATYHLPARVVGLAEWGRECGAPAGLLAQLARNGVERFHATEGETVLDMACRAVERLLREGGIDPTSIDILIHVHTLQTSVLPAPASLPAAVARRFSMAPTQVFSVNQQNCVSFLAGLRLARAAIAAHSETGRALIVATDRMLFPSGRMVDDNGIHSDGAAALLVERGAARNHIVAIKHMSNGRAYLGAGSVEERRFSAIYHINTIKLIREAVHSAGFELSDLSAILPHNMNLLGWRRIMAALRLPDSVCFQEAMHSVGHICCGDAMVNLARCDRLERGRPFLIYANGYGGFSGAAVLIH